ncbi:uncharacterized protein [Arachis hypogaea]|uniref:uncharacterized protein isoform X1 n=1 Tax=Arachis hypogaea TaxID=3818 RepID=UPI003B2216C2
MGFEKEKKDKVDWSYDWVSEDVKSWVSLFCDEAAVREVDANRIVRAGSGVKVELLPCSVDDRIYHRELGFDFFYMHSCVLEELRVRLPFTDFECQILKQLNCAPSQLHPNGWAFLRSFEVLMEFLEELPSVSLFFSLFQAKGVWKGGWVNFNSTPGFGIFKLYKSSFKDFKEMYFKVRSSEEQFPFYIDENLAEKFPLFWCSEPQNILGPEVISPRNECLIEYLVENVDRKNLISMYELLKWEDDKVAVVEYLGGKYPGVSAASLRTRFKSKNLDKEVSSSNVEKVVGGGEVSQPRQGRRKVIVKKRKRSELVELSDDSDGKELDVPLEEIHAFMGNQKRLHEMSEESEAFSVWGKEYPFMAVVDEYCQSSADVTLAKEVGDMAIGQYMQVVGLWLASLGRSQELKYKGVAAEKGEVPVLKEELVKYKKLAAELQGRLTETEKLLKETKENYSKDVEDLKKKESDLVSVQSRLIEVTAQFKDMEKKKADEILDSFVEGFERARLQVKFLVPDADLSSMDPGKIVRDGQLVDDDGDAEGEADNV